MIGSLTRHFISDDPEPQPLVPCIHGICFANSIAIGAAEYASFSVPASALQRPVPNATKIKNASVRVGFVRVVVHHSRWKTPISLQFNFRQNAVANDRLLLGGPRRLLKAYRCDERKDNRYQANLHDVTSGNSASYPVGLWSR